MNFNALSALAVLIGCLTGSGAIGDVVISNKPTQNMNCQGGVCTATAKKAVMNVADLVNMLASGDATVSTGNIAKDIEIDQPLSWSSASRLTLDAERSLTVKKAVTVAGSGAVTINYNTNDGDLVFLKGGKVDFSDMNSSLVINGAEYVLANDVASLAAAVAKDDSGNYAFAADYDAANETYDDAPVAGLTGAFEGLGHTISHLNIRQKLRKPFIGFFGAVGGVVRDVALEKITVGVGKALNAGALAGQSGALIAHVRVSGRIRAKEARQAVGGLVGWNQGTITKSVSEMQGDAPGGIAGVNLGQIDQCFALGDFSQAGGGLVWNLGQGMVSNSYSTGNLLAGQGGLIDYGNINVVSSYSTGQVARVNGSGGFVGEVDSNAAQNDYWDTDTSGQTQGCGSGDCSNITGLSDAQLKSGLPKGFDPKIWAHDPKINGGYPYLINNPPQ